MGEKSRSRGWCGWIIVLIVLAVVVAVVVLTIKKKSNHSNEAAPVPGPPGAPVKKYGDALQIAMQFFDVQKCRFLLISFIFLFFVLLQCSIFSLRCWSFCVLMKLLDVTSLIICVTIMRDLKSYMSFIMI